MAFVGHMPYTRAMRQDAAGVTLQTIASLAPLSGSRVLEVGCGTGRVTAMVAGLPALLCAAEPCASHARLAAGVAGAHVAAAAAEGLPYADASFDVLLFTLSLHHADSPRALAEASRVTAPGGRIVAVEPGLHGVIQRLGHIFEDETCRLERGAAALADEAALARTGLVPLARREFTTLWEFEDFDELCAYQYDYYSQEPDPATTARMRSLVGSRRADERPLVLEDELVATVLGRGEARVVVARDDEFL
jgi:SAM-dependent methyltransferase